MMWLEMGLVMRVSGAVDGSVWVASVGEFGLVLNFGVEGGNPQCPPSLRTRVDISHLTKIWNYNFGFSDNFA